MISIVTRSRYGSAAPFVVLSPVPRVAGEYQPLARACTRSARTDRGRPVARRRGQPPHLRERAGLERRAELVPRQDRQVVENPHAGRERLGERDDDGRADRAAATAAACRRPSGAASPPPSALVVRRLERKQHIVGRERVAVGERDVRPQLHACSAGRRSERVQDSASQGSTSW